MKTRQLGSLESLITTEMLPFREFLQKDYGLYSYTSYVCRENL